MTEPKQAIILSPIEVEPADSTELSLSGYLDGIEVFHQGLDFSDQEVKAFFAEGEFGSRPIDHVWPLRPVKIPLMIRPTGSLTFDQVRARLQAKVAQINQQGGARLKRVLPSGAFLYLDLVEAKLHLSASWSAENRDFDREAMLELQALPDMYGPEVVGTAHEFTGDGAFTEIIPGDIPARVINMQVEDRSANDQLGLMWHYRGEHHSSAATAEWAYDAEALGPLDIAEKTTLAGSYGTKIVAHKKLSTEWTPVLSTNMAGSTFLTHAGLYAVWARVYTTSEDLPWLRLAYGAGDVVAPEELRQVQVPGSGAFYIVPLGQINIPALPFGAQRWEGVIQARGEKGGENISIDRLWFQCGDESSGVLAARRSTTALVSTDGSDGLVTHSAEGKEESLNGTEGLRGGKWEESGSTKKWASESKGPGFIRSTKGTVREANGETEGRTAILSNSTVGSALVKVELSSSELVVGLFQGIYLRYYDATHWVRLSLPEGTVSGLVLECDAGSGVEVRGYAEIPPVAPNVFVMLEASLDSAAEVTAVYGAQSHHWILPAAFRKGETYAEGKVGIYDLCTSKLAAPKRTYRNFVATALAPHDAVIYANKSAYLSTQGNYRQSEDGLGASPVGYPGADLPRLPVSGPSETPVEIAVKPSRGQLGEFPDSGIDPFKVQLIYRCCSAEIPSS